MYNQGDNEPVIRPSRPETAQLLMSFQSFPEAERSEEMSTQQAYLREKIAMDQELLNKYKRRNKDMKMNLLLHRFHEQGKSFENFSRDELCDLLSYLEEKKSELNKRIAYVEGLAQAEGNNKPQVPDQGFITGHSSTKN
ncbi:agamous-like MADS-box protein AGL80 [Syzygium oleosum]|uniref:agamous-like MADS-box protein AGL80 n=1 Tax=Syzygium oleosum TaxID=219896 RepID=UPI0024BA9F8D|nr:agamous-like MADS-box protein AGL80 [Syzygium oleosum]